MHDVYFKTTNNMRAHTSKDSKGSKGAMCYDVRHSTQLLRYRD